jgi:segregation and condensation protein B
LERVFLKKAIESILFVSQKPVSIRDLHKVFSDVDLEEIAGCLEELIREWRDLDRGFSIYEVGGGYQFRTCPSYSDFIARFKEIKPFKLSRAALEVLAIVAYRQPITRLEIDYIRGVDSSGVIGVLLDKRLIEIKGRKEVVGRPFLYGTTQEFLEVFGLRSLEDLPTLKEIEEIDRELKLISGD